MILTFELFGAGNAVFDASQYAFFGNDVVEEVELGGLEDEEDGLPPPGFDDVEYQLEQEEVASEALVSFKFFGLTSVLFP